MFRKMASIFRISLDFSIIDFKTRFVGNLIGPLWLFLNPLALFIAYYFIYTYIYRIKDPALTTNAYLLHMISGLTVFLFFSECLSTSTHSLRSNISILKNTSFPAIIFPTKNFLNCCINFLVSFAIILLGSMILGYRYNILLLFFIIMLLFLFVYGLSLPISLISLALKDLSQIIVFFNLVVMLASPIGFTISQVPEKIKNFVLLNPLALFITTIQDIIVHNNPVALTDIVKLMVLSFGTFSIGLVFFLKGKKVVSSYV